jgi:hypothetical protein
MELVTVFTTLNPAEADFVRSELEAADFDVAIANEYSAVTLAPSTASGGIRVQVPADQAEEAKALLDATVNSKDQTKSEDESSSSTS